MLAASHLAAAAAITDGLIAYWPFDETSGTIAADATTNSNPGTLYNFPSDNSEWVTGRIGNALQFRGPASGDYVRVPNYPKPTTNITVAAWVWADARPSWASIAKNWGSGMAGQFHFGLTANDGDLSCYLGSSTGATPNQRENVLFPSGKWQHVAFTADGQSLKVYRNGAQVGSAPDFGGLLAPSMAALGIGVKLDDTGLAPDPGAPGYWQGKIDDLGIWDRALNTAEIAAIVAAGLQGKGLTNAEAQPVITGGGVRISEFMASNRSILLDDFGEASDWIEIHNDTPVTVNLDGWFLTDNSSKLTQWRFPATNLPPGTFLLVFASGRDRRVPGAALHTNFKLDAGGEYLALVRPDNTVATDFAPIFPAQVTDVSFGFGLGGGNSLNLLGPGSPGRALVPGSGALGSNWISSSFDDSVWTVVTNGLGFETGVNEFGGGAVNDLIADSPVAWWRLSETNGGWSTNTGSLAPVGIGQWSGGVTPGVAGPQPPNFLGFQVGNRAAHFDGVAGKIEADYTPDLNPSGPFTVECWVRPAFDSVLLSPLSSLNYAGSSRAGYVFYQDGANQWEFHLGDASGYVASAVGGAAEVNVWQHLAGVYSGTNAVLYVNGSAVASAVLNRPFAPNRAQKFRLGAGGSGTGHRYFAGEVDEAAVFNRALSAAEISQRYQIAVNNLPEDSTNNFNYSGLISTDLQRLMYGSNATVYFRLPFVLTNAAALNRLTLRLRYDDGFVAFLNGTRIQSDNAPDPIAWNSASPARRATSDVLQSAQFDISVWTSLLRDGTNLLVLQGLNYGSTNADFLLLPELDAAPVGHYESAPLYFTRPTPGGPNGVGSRDLGPIITLADHAPGVPGTNDDLTISCRVSRALATVDEVTLNWRVMYGITNQTRMFDDGRHGDGAAGDGIYGAVIDHTNYLAGQMVRWFISAADALGGTSRWPLFSSPPDSTEYLGTVVQPDALATNALPVLHWFVENSSAADTDTGTRCSLFYAGRFYDNLRVRIRGGTSRSWPKKSYKFEMNSGDRLFVREDLPWVSEFNLNATYTDKSYVRSVLAAELQRDAGLPVMDEFHLHVQQNNQFFGVAIYVEQPNDDFLRRHGLDPEGALYKALGDPVGAYEKKTRLYEDQSDLNSLLVGLKLAGTNLENFIFDNLNLADAVNFMATVAICQNIDASDKNHYLYRDTSGTREWRIFPWDLDLTFGPEWLNTDSMVSSLCDTNAPHCPSHPFIGARPYILHTGKYHPLLEAIVGTPRARQMLLRRLRTLLDQFLASNYFEDRMDQLFPTLDYEVQRDRALWGANAHFPGQTYTLRQALDRIKNEYLAPRRAFFATSAIVGIGPDLPASQPTSALIGFAGLDYNPSSGNQDEEYVCLTNANSVAVDVSGWKLSGGVQHIFEAGTVIPARGALYVSPNAAAFRARAVAPHGGMGLFVQGNYEGHLNAWGESLSLTNSAGSWVASTSFPGSPSLAQRYLRITEIMYNPSPATDIATDPQQFEYVEVKNISTNVILDLTGVRFTGGISFSFTGGAITNLPPGQTVLVVANQGAFTARCGSGLPIAGQYAGALGNGGDTLRLQDAVGEKVIEFTYHNTWYPLSDGLGFALVVVNENAPREAWGQKANWRASGRLNGSPGVVDPLPQAFPPVRVNEVLSHSDSGTDWIELYNPATTNANVGGWFLTDGYFNPKRYRIPTGTILLPGAYFMLLGTNSFALGPQGFRLSEYGEEIYLFSGDESTNLTGYYHGFAFGAAPNNLSVGRHITSQGEEKFVLQSASTPGTNNALPRVGPVVISEIMYHAPEAANGMDSTLNEFVELQNITSTNVPLFGTFTNEPGYGLAAVTNTWRLRKAVAYDFPTNLALSANSRILVVGFDPVAEPGQLAEFRTLYGVPVNVGVYGPWLGKLNHGGETIELTSPDKPDVTSTNLTVPYVMVDQVAYQDVFPWPVSAAGLGSSLQRQVPGDYGNDPANWVGVLPTAGRINTFGPRPAITALNVWPSVRVSFLAAPGLACLLEYKNHLTDPDWTPIPPIVIGTAGVLTLTDTNSVTTQRFYRIGVR